MFFWCRLVRVLILFSFWLVKGFIFKRRGQGEGGVLLDLVLQGPWSCFLFGWWGGSRSCFALV